MGGLPISGAALNFFHAEKEISPCKEPFRPGMAITASEEESSLSIISDFFELIKNDRLLTAKEANGAAQLLYLLDKQGRSHQNIYFANKLELEVISAVTNNLIKLASRRYLRQVSVPTVNFLNYLNHSNLPKNSFVSNISNLAGAAADFARLKYVSVSKTRETVNKFLEYFENAQSYSSQTALNKMLFKLEVINLAAHSGPNIPKFTQKFLYALKESNIYKNHPMSEMANAILEKKSNFIAIKNFFKLTEISDIKEAVIGFLALFLDEGTWREYINADNKSEEESLRYITNNLLRFINHHNDEKSEAILHFAIYVSQSNLTENRHALDMAATILSFISFLGLKISPDFKNIFLNYLQTDNIPGTDEKEKFTAHLTRFANTVDVRVAESLCSLLTHLSLSKMWKNHWLSSLAADVLGAKEKNMPSVGAFISLVSQSEVKKKSKKSEIEKFSLKFSVLLKNEGTQFIDEFFRKQINQLIACQYNQATGELNPPEGKAKIVMDFLDDFVKLRKWDDQEANELALYVADMIIALRDFLKIKNSSDSKITDEQIKRFKNSFLAYLQTEADEISKKAKEKQKFVKFERDLNSCIMTRDEEISGPTSYLISCLNKLEVWEDHRISKLDKFTLKMSVITPFVKVFSELWDDKQIRQYFENHTYGNILSETVIDAKFFLALLLNEGMLGILSPDYIKVSGRDIKASLIARLIFLVNDANKRVSDATFNILNRLNNSKEWEGHPAQEIAHVVLLEPAHKLFKRPLGKC